MDIALGSLLYDKLELATLCAVALVMVALVADLCHCVAEHSLGPLDLRCDLREIGEFQRRAIFLDDSHHIDVIDEKIAVLLSEFVLRKIESLIHKIDVLVLHPKKTVNL